KASVWATTDGKQDGKPVQHSVGMMAVAWPDSGPLVFTRHPEGTVVDVWDAKAKLVASLHHRQLIVRAVAVSRDGSRIATACGDGKVHLWDPSGKKPMERHLGPEFGRPPESPLAGVYAVAFASDNRTVLAHHDQGARLQQWGDEAKDWAVKAE